MIIFKVKKNQCFTLYLEDAFLEKPQEVGREGVINGPSAFLGLIMTAGTWPDK